MKSKFGEAVVNTIAIAAGFWRIHKCTKPLNPHDMKVHNCTNYGVFANGKCRLCTAIVPQDEQ